MHFREHFVCEKVEFCESAQILMSSQCEPLPYLWEKIDIFGKSWKWKLNIFM